MSSMIFIDARVASVYNPSALFANDTQVVILDASQGGIEQIVAALAGITDLSAIHIISHGSAGTLYLGTTTLNSSNLTDFKVHLAGIGNSLADTGDILLYGCDVASGDAGQAFIQQIAVLTGADVAASTDLTGSAALGGNWILEESTGVIESVAMIDNSFAAVLATAALSGSNSSNAAFTSAKERKSTPITIAGAPGDAVITSVLVAWDVDANYVGDI